MNYSSLRTVFDFAESFFVVSPTLSGRASNSWISFASYSLFERISPAAVGQLRTNGKLCFIAKNATFFSQLITPKIEDCPAYINREEKDIVWFVKFELLVTGFVSHLVCLYPSNLLFCYYLQTTHPRQ